MMAKRMALAIAKRMAKLMRLGWQKYAPNPNPNPNNRFAPITESACPQDRNARGSNGRAS